MLYCARPRAIVSVGVGGGREGGGRVISSVEILNGARRQPFSEVFGISFRNHPFDNTCGPRIKMKFSTVFLQIENFECPSMPKSLIPFLEKIINRNINDVDILYK